MLDADHVVKARQNEIINEVGEIEQEVKELQERIEKLQTKRQMRIAEYELLDRMQDRSLVFSSSKTGRVDRLTFEDCIKRIFDNKGRPMKISEILKELEKFNFVSSSYQSAYSQITKKGIVEPVSRGYYQLVRNR
jgi:alanyl-tRNA synthetase